VGALQDSIQPESLWFVEIGASGVDRTGPQSRKAKGLGQPRDERSQAQRDSKRDGQPPAGLARDRREPGLRVDPGSGRDGQPGRKTIAAPGLRLDLEQGRATAVAALAAEKVRPGEPSVEPAAWERTGLELAVLELEARAGHSAQNRPEPDRRGTAPRELTGRNLKSAALVQAGLTGRGRASHDQIRREPADSRQLRRHERVSSDQTTHGRRDRGLNGRAVHGRVDLGNGPQALYAHREPTAGAGRTCQAAAPPRQAGHSAERVRQVQEGPAAVLTAEHDLIQGVQMQHARRAAPDGNRNHPSMERESRHSELDRAALGRDRHQRAVHETPRAHRAQGQVESGQAENAIKHERRPWANLSVWATTPHSIVQPHSSPIDAGGCNF
jgi:hypothetical protein